MTVQSKRTYEETLIIGKEQVAHYGSYGAQELEENVE